MAHATNIHLNSAIKLNNLIEFGRDYCSDQLGHFFQNKYSLPALALDKFEIPAKLATRSAPDSFAICVMMNNHIVDLNYFGDIFADWDQEMQVANVQAKPDADKINQYIHDPRLLAVIKRFKKFNDEIVIGRCNGLEFTPL